MQYILSVTNESGSKCELYCDIKGKQEIDILYISRVELVINRFFLMC